MQWLSRVTSRVYTSRVPAHLLHVALAEQEAGAGEVGEVWCGHGGVSPGHVRPAEVVRHQQENVGGRETTDSRAAVAGTSSSSRAGTMTRDTVTQLVVEVSSNRREVSQCPEKAY